MARDNLVNLLGVVIVIGIVTVTVAGVVHLFQ
jgi:hypothetical protein